MIYIFEDNEKATTSRLFRTAYDKEVSGKFIYSEGNGNLKDIVIDKLNHTNEIVAVYMDTIPGNKDIRKLYKEIRLESINHNNRVLMFPIVCSEYYFIKSIYNSHIMVDKVHSKEAIDKKFFKNSTLLSTAEDIKFCKLILKKCVKDCARQFEKAKLPDELKDIHEIYYDADCICKMSRDTECKELSLVNKSLQLLKQYEYVPSGTNVNNINSVSLSEAYQIHKKMVDTINEMTQRFKSADPEREKDYKTYNYFDEYEQP